MKPAIQPEPATMNYEHLTPEQFGQRLGGMKASWVYEQIRDRARDPLPHVKLGKYVRIPWGHPDVVAWWERRLKG